MIFALGVLAACPALHSRLHNAATKPADDGCAVVLFATGVSVPLAAITLAAPDVAWREFARPAVREVFLVSPRYLRQPERGPPAV